MSRIFIAERAAVLAVLLVAMFGVNSQVLGQSARVVGKFGQAQVEGRDVIVHVTVTVPPGADANQVALDAIRNQGARPFQSDEFSTTGLVWDQFFDGESETDQVVQHYNPANDPTGGGLNALWNTHVTWTEVGTSKFVFDLDPIPTDRCPSLVKECKGRQTFDGLNDVAWVEIRGCCTLAVTWYGTSIDEADMAINTRFSWATDGTGDFDLQTVILHENGHVGGLGHSEVQDAVMFASYQTMRQDLHQDDIDGITLLYPDATGAIDGTVTQEGGLPIVGATVSVYGTSIEATTDSAGGYAITIAPGTYDLTASALGFIEKSHLGVSVDVDSTAVKDFFLVADLNPPDSGSLVISNVSSQKSGKGGNFKITWNTNNPADSEVIFACCGTFSNSELVTDHSMSFRSQKGVTYQYSVKSTDAAGNTVTAVGFSHVN